MIPSCLSRRVGVVCVSVCRWWGPGAQERQAARAGGWSDLEAGGAHHPKQKSFIHSAALVEHLLCAASLRKRPLLRVTVTVGFFINPASQKQCGCRETELGPNLDSSRVALCDHRLVTRHSAPRFLHL